jgi:predicted  nucleic acid-binding Zn-ribbon protein
MEREASGQSRELAFATAQTKQNADKIHEIDSRQAGMVKKSREIEANVAALESRLEYMGEASKNKPEGTHSLQEFETMIHKLRKEFREMFVTDQELADLAKDVTDL